MKRRIAGERILDAGHVLAGFVEMRRARRGDAAPGILRRHREVDHQVGPQQRRVGVQQPVEIEAARGVAGQRGEQIAIGEHGLAGPQRRQDRGFDAVPEIHRVKQRIFFGRQRADLLAHLEQRLDERRRGPARRDDLVVAALEPALEQLALRGLARSRRAPRTRSAARATSRARAISFRSSIQAGSSMYSLILTRNCTASRPSTMR